MTDIDWALGVLVLFAMAWHLRTAIVLDRHAAAIDYLTQRLERISERFPELR